MHVERYHPFAGQKRSGPISQKKALLFLQKEIAARRKVSVETIDPGKTMAEHGFRGQARKIVVSSACDAAGVPGLNGHLKPGMTLDQIAELMQTMK